jgi:hypothetical protein
MTTPMNLLKLVVKQAGGSSVAGLQQLALISTRYQQQKQTIRVMVAP